mgnify:CR=1 FL=1
MWGDIAIAFLLAFITAFVITPYSIRWAKKVGAVDYPNDRRVNKKPMPRLRRPLRWSPRLPQRRRTASPMARIGKHMRVQSAE